MNYNLNVLCEFLVKCYLYNMKTYFLDNKSNEIILFLLAWGMDEKPMLPLKSKKRYIISF